MKTLNRTALLNKSFLFILLFSFSAIMFAQDDTTTQGDTQEKKEKKARSSFKVSAGVTINSLSLDSADGVDSKAGIGYDLGISYKRGRFLYYEVGARYNNRKFNLSAIDDENAQENSFSVSAIDIPITGGINITSFADRLIGVRVFISAVPSFNISESIDDELNFLDDNISSFLFYGQGGVGIDIAFFFIEAGFNYGFSDIFDFANESIKSNPSQGYLNIGFRF